MLVFNENSSNFKHKKSCIGDKKGLPIMRKTFNFPLTSYRILKTCMEDEHRNIKPYSWILDKKLDIFSTRVGDQGFVKSLDIHNNF